MFEHIKKIMKYFILLITLPLFIVSCISIKSEYPKIDYYRLTQDATSLKDLKKQDVTLQIRSFNVSQDIDTDHLLAQIGSNQIKVYYYHRWVTDVPSMVTDFFISRFSQYEIFKGSVVGTNTIAIPDYIVEGQVLDMIAYNSLNNEPGTNSVVVTLKVNIIKYNALSIDKDIISSEIYTNRTYRSDNTASSIAPAFSKCFSLIGDMVLSDIIKAIDKSNIKN